MGIFLVLHWWVWLGVTVAGLLIGLAASNLLEVRRPQWTARKRSTAAAVIAPGIILAAALTMAAVVRVTAEPDSWDDLAALALLQLGLVLALVAAAASLLGAWLAGRAGRP